MCNYIYHHQSKYANLDVQIMIHSVIYTKHIVHIVLVTEKLQKINKYSARGPTMAENSPWVYFFLRARWKICLPSVN
jgi:hypothetical protein